MQKSKFVNGNRTKEERRCNYCMLRTLFNLSRKQARILVNWRKSIQVRYLEESSGLIEWVDLEQI
jgi:hypothetical protein